RPLEGIRSKQPPVDSMARPRASTFNSEPHVRDPCRNHAASRRIRLCRTSLPPSSLRTSDRFMVRGAKLRHHRGDWCEYRVLHLAVLETIPGGEGVFL